MTRTFGQRHGERAGAFEVDGQDGGAGEVRDVSDAGLRRHALAVHAALGKDAHDAPALEHGRGRLEGVGVPDAALYGERAEPVEQPPPAPVEQLALAHEPDAAAQRQRDEQRIEVRWMVRRRDVAAAGDVLAPDDAHARYEAQHGQQHDERDRLQPRRALARAPVVAREQLGRRKLLRERACRRLAWAQWREGRLRRLASSRQQAGAGRAFASWHRRQGTDGVPRGQPARACRPG